MEESRLWVVVRGQRVDVTDQVDENTPYVDTWWDEEGNLYYVIVGGTPEDYGWYQGVTAPDGSGGGNGVLSSRTGVSPQEQTDPEWFTRGREQVRELWYAQWNGKVGIIHNRRAAGELPAAPFELWGKLTRDAGH